MRLFTRLDAAFDAVPNPGAEAMGAVGAACRACPGIQLRQKEDSGGERRDQALCARPYQLERRDGRAAGGASGGELRRGAAFGKRIGLEKY